LGMPFWGKTLCPLVFFFQFSEQSPPLIGNPSYEQLLRQGTFPRSRFFLFRNSSLGGSSTFSVLSRNGGFLQIKDLAVLPRLRLTFFPFFKDNFFSAVAAFPVRLRFYPKRTFERILTFPLVLFVMAFPFYQPLWIVGTF